MLTKIATASFFESVFSEASEQREQAREFLANGLVDENDEVEVSGQYLEN